MSLVTPSVVHGVSAVADNERTVMPFSDNMDRLSLMITSPSECLSGSTFPDSDTGYFGSPGLYEGSCDHLEYDYGRRYSDDVEVFTDERAETARGPISVESLVAVSHSESLNAVPDGAKQLELSNEELFAVPSVCVSSESHLATLRKTDSLNKQGDTVAGIDLSEDSLKMCQDVHLSADASVPGQPQTIEADGLSEVAGRYTTIQQLLEMNRQRVGLPDADQLMLDCSLPGCESLTGGDCKAVVSLAADYPVINECLQLGRVTSKKYHLDSSSVDFKTSASKCSLEMSEKPQAVEKSADVTVNNPAVKDFGASLLYSDQAKDHGHGNVETTDRHVSRESDMYINTLMTSVASVAQSEPRLIYMATERPHYHPVYSRLRDVESGLLKASPYSADDTAVRHGLVVDSSDAEEIPRDMGHTTEQVCVYYDADTVQYLRHYDSLALLSDVESGKVPSHRDADFTVLPLTVGQILSKHKSEKEVNVSEAENVESDVKNQELSCKNYSGQADLDSNCPDDGFTVVETKRHRRQRKKQHFEDIATESSTLSQSSPSLDDSHVTAVQHSEAENMPTAETVQPLETEQSRLAQALGSDTTAEGLIQNFSEEFTPDVDNIAAVTDVCESEEISSVLQKDLEMKAVLAVPDVVSENIMVDVSEMPQKLESTGAPLNVTVPVSTGTADRLEDAAKLQTVADAGRQLGDKNLLDEMVPGDTETLPMNVAEDRNAKLLEYAAVESEVGERMKSDVQPTVDDVATFTGRTVTNVAEKPQAEVVTVPEVASLLNQAAVSDLAGSLSHETVRVERITTVAPRSVVRITGELHSDIADENIEGSYSAFESSVMTENVAPVENKPEESTVQSIHKGSVTAEGCIVALREGYAETGAVDDSKVSWKEVSEMVAPASDVDVKISENTDAGKTSFETKIAKVAHMPYDLVKAEKVIAHYASLAVLADVDGGKVHNRLKSRRFLREWSAENVDDVVAYIVGSETTKHRRKHRRVKRASESEFIEVKATESGSELMKPALPRAKSEENVPSIDEQPDQWDAMGSDVEEQTIEDDTEGADFTIVESRKHRRLRQRHDTDEAWAQCLDNEDASEQAEVMYLGNEMESSADSLHCPIYNDTEAVSESAAISLNAEEVVDVLSEAIKIPSGELKMARDALDAETMDVPAKYATQSEPAAELVCGHEPDTKLDSLADDASEICEPVDKAVTTLVSQPQEVEIHKDAEIVHPPTSVTEPVQDGVVPVVSAKSIQDVRLESTIPFSDSYVVRDVHSRLYSDVARGKYDADKAVSEPGKETATNINVEVAVRMDVSNECDESIVAELHTESVGDVWPKTVLDTENELSAEVPFNSSLTVSPEMSPDIDVVTRNAGELVDECSQTVQTELHSEVTVLSDVTWPDAETTENISPSTDHSVEAPFTKPVIMQQQPLDVHMTEESVSLVDLKPDVELSQYYVKEPLTEVMDAELPPSASDTHKLPTSSHLLSDDNKSLRERSAAEPDVESHILINRTEVSDVSSVSKASVECPSQLLDAENLESSASHSVTEILREQTVELPGLSSTDEPSVPVPAGESVFGPLLHASDAESATDPTVDLPVTDVAACITEDEQHVAQLFSEGLRAVQIRSDSEAVVETAIANDSDEVMPDLQVEVTDSCSEDTSKKSALLAVESFVVEILPYYYAALAALQDVERGAVQLPGDILLQAASKKTTEMSHGVMKPCDVSDFTVPAVDQELSNAVTVLKSQKVEELMTEKEAGIQETVFSDVSYPSEAALSSSVRMDEHLAKVRSETVHPTARRSVQPTVQTGTVAETKDNRQLDRNHTDVVALQCHYQSLKLLRSVEAGELPLPSAQLAACIGHSATVTEQAADILSTEQLKRKSVDSFAEYKADLQDRSDLECKVSSPVQEVSSIDVSVVCAERGERSTDRIELTSSDILAMDDLAPAAERSDLGFGSVVDNLSEAQSIPDAEHGSVTFSSDSARVSSECGQDAPSSTLLTGESRLPIRTADNVIEVDVRESQRDVSFLQARSGVDSYTMTTGDTKNTMEKCCFIANQCHLSEEAVSTDLTQQIASDVHIRDFSLLQQQQHTEIKARPSTSINDGELQAVLDAEIVDVPAKYATESLPEQRTNEDVTYFNEQQPSEEETMQMSREGIPSTTLEQAGELQTKRKRKNRKKKPKPAKDDVAHPAATPCCDDLSSVNENNTVGENVSEICAPADAQPRNIADDGVQTTTSASTEASASLSPKKNKKRKRTKKDRRVAEDNTAVIEETDASQTAVTSEVQSIVSNVHITDRVSEEQSQNVSFLVADTSAKQGEVGTFKEAAHGCSESGKFPPMLPPVGIACSESVELSSDNTDDNIAPRLQRSDRTPSSEESMPVGSVTDVAATPAAEEDSVEKPSELLSHNVDVAVCDSTTVDKSTSCAKPAKKKNRSKRKSKTAQIPLHDTATTTNGLPTTHDNSITEDREQLGNVVVAEIDEIMTESLEEDARITEQPLDVLSMDISKEMSEPSSLHFHPPLSEYVGKKKKKKRKAIASDVVLPFATVDRSSDLVTESLHKAKDDVSEKDEILAPLETETTDLSVALGVSTKELDNTSYVLLSVDEGRKEAEAQQHFDAGSNGDSSSDESIRRSTHPPEPSADSTVVSASSKKRKKKRKRNRQKRISQPDAETDTDLYSLLTRIIEICSETKDGQTAEDGCQTQSSHESGKPGTQSVIVPKAARKPRRYKRSKPVRLPPDIEEQASVEHVCSSIDKAGADTVSPTRGSQSPGGEDRQTRPAAAFSEETRSELDATGKFSESIPQPTSAKGDTTVSDSHAAGRSATIPNAEATETGIAWTASASKTDDLSSEYLQPKSFSQPDLTDPCECRTADESGSVLSRTEDFEDAVADRYFLSIRPADVTQNEPQETCVHEDDREPTSAESQDGATDRTQPADIAGCLTADVFAVISAENTDELLSGDPVSFTSEPIDGRFVVTPEYWQVPGDVDSVVEIPDPLWLHAGDGLLHAPATSGACETSSVDSEVERIFADGQTTFDVHEGDGASSHEDGACTAQYADEDLEREEDDVYIVTEYVDVEIIEETETVRVLDNDDDEFTPIRHHPDVSLTPPGAERILSGVSPSGAADRLKESAEDDARFPPYGFRLHQNEDEHQLAGFPSDFGTETAKTATVGIEDGAPHYDPGQNSYHPGWFNDYSTTGGAFRWPFASTDRAPRSEVADSWRISRKRKHTSEDTTSSDSDDKLGSDGSQFVIAQHQPVDEAEGFAPCPVWPFFEGDPWWTSEGVMIGADGNIVAGESVEVSKPPSAPWCRLAAAGPTDFELDDGSRPGFVPSHSTGGANVHLHRGTTDSPQDADDLSGDSLNELCSSPSAGGLLRDLSTASTEVVSSSGRVCGGWESCSTDSLDTQTKSGPRHRPRQRRRSSTGCISEDSLAETSSAAREDPTANRDPSPAESPENAAAASGERVQDVGRRKVSARPKRFSGVRAKFKCPKPGVGAAKKGLKRKLGNAATKDDSETGDTDSDSAELE